MAEQGGVSAIVSESDSEKAHVMLEKLGDVAEEVTTTRVIFASLVALFLSIASI